MSYLETLMKKNPQEVDGKQIFIKCKDERRTIVPVNIESSSQEEVVVVEQKKENKQFRETNKNSLRKNDNQSSKKSGSFNKSSDKKERDPFYSKAFEKAQETLAKDCRPTKDDDSIISQSVQYIHNWNGHHIKVDVSDDNIVINLEDKEYKFSKKRFLSNRHFQRCIIEEYNQVYGNVYLKFFQKKNEDDIYTIHVKAGRKN
jgi:hypothetical protein